MDFCHIAPTAHLSDFCSEQRAHLVLAHLLETDQPYVDWYRARHPDETIILDNSAFELYKQGREMYPSDKLIELGKRVNANYVVLSDYPNQPWQKTRDAALDLIPKFVQAGLGTFYCPQAPIGDISSLLESYRWAADHPGIKYIGVSILAVPNAYGVEKDNKLQRFLARWRWMQLLDEQGILRTIQKNKKKLHFLGMVDGPNEILLVREYIRRGLIASWDSSAAVWAGLNGIRFDSSPSGLLNGKYESHVDFAAKKYEWSSFLFAKENVKYINQLVDSCLK